MIKGLLVLTDKKDDFDEICGVQPTCYDFGLSLYIDSDYPLEKQLANKELISDAFDDYIKFLNDNYSSDVKMISTYQSVRDDIDNLYEKIEYVFLDFDSDNCIDFIEKHPIIQNKKIVLPITLTLNDEYMITQLFSKYDKYKDNIYVLFERNMGYISLTDCLNTINKVKEVAGSILSLNLSPMETIMYTYDLVRNREYVEEGVNDSNLDSRDLTSVLFGDKIVCVGFSNIFSALLNYMGIKCNNVGLDFKDESLGGGHERNVIYVQDEKYDIDGVYYFDPTWDSKKNGQYNQFLNNYRCFAKTRNQMMSLEKNCYNYKRFKYYFDDMVSMASDFLLGSDSLEMVNYADSINYMAKLVGQERLIEQSILLVGFPEKRVEFLEKLKSFGSVQEKFNKPISAEVFIKLLNNVRKVQYYQNPEFYPYTINSLCSAYYRSGCEFDKHHFSSSELLIRRIFGENSVLDSDDRDHKMEDFVNFIRNENIGTNIKQVQLTKVLQKHYNNNL